MDVQTDVVHDFLHGCLVPFIDAESYASRTSLVADRSPHGDNPRYYTEIKHPLNFFVKPYGLGHFTRMNKIRKPSPPGISSSVLTIRRYADSLVGLTIKEAKSRFRRGTTRMTEWKAGKQLVISLPKYEVRVLFLKDEAVLASVQILSK